MSEKILRHRQQALQNKHFDINVNQEGFTLLSSNGLYKLENKDDYSNTHFLTLNIFYPVNAIRISNTY